MPSSKPHSRPHGLASMTICHIGFGRREGLGPPGAWAFLSPCCQAASSGLCLAESGAPQRPPGPSGRPGSHRKWERLRVLRSSRPSPVLQEASPAQVPLQDGAGPPCPLLGPQCQVGLHSHTVVVSEGAAGLRDNHSEPKDSLGSSVCWAGLPPSDHPPLESGGKLLRAASACPTPRHCPLPGDSL